LQCNPDAEHHPPAAEPEVPMPGDVLRHGPQLTMEQFHAFRDERPKEEKWELIDGVPIMMPPPTLVHQRIADNLNQLLNARLLEVKPEWRAQRDTGVWLRGDEKYNPEPDVVIADATITRGQIYARRFYLTAEVLSPSDKKPVVAAKLRYYQEHEHNRCILLVRQDRIGAEQHIREGGTWRRRRLSSPTAKLDIPNVGVIGRLGDLYKATPLDPFVRKGRGQTLRV
jgi:Uma2 family endonuclease